MSDDIRFFLIMTAVFGDHHPVAALIMLLMACYDAILKPLWLYLRRDLSH